ncbi:unnamed protein product [Angiostrongylus costaricensis]|uniref:DNA polymerase epsilon subunit 3 n=1 Tax=Angiostrongylus costaricensis TaxID=334426 RepID=A0A0R3PN94_ANGCS|nr:unnamed protein product [Angiostrongylus costaricensis]
MADTKIEDLRLPHAIVSRIVDKAIGQSGTVSKEARTAIARAASVFILNVTSYANDYAITKKRKTMTTDDIFQALNIIESDHISAPLLEALEAWRTNKAHKSGEAKKRKAEKKTAAAPGSTDSYVIALSEEMRLRTTESES